MSILQYCPDCKQHAQFVETLMRYKSDVCLDILAVLAYGPQPVINSAGQVLLHYYPLKDVGKACLLLLAVSTINNYHLKQTQTGRL